jgi:hypothetical protein
VQRLLGEHVEYTIGHTRPAAVRMSPGRFRVKALKRKVFGFPGP